MLFVFMAYALNIGGCSTANYDSNMKARENIAFYETANKARAMDSVAVAIKSIINVVEGEVEEQNARMSQRFADDDQAIGNNYAIAVMGDIVIQMSSNQSKVQLADARARAIQYLEPLLLAIYENGTQDYMEGVGTPMTGYDVASEFMTQLPFLATVAGMYGLGVKGIENAGTKLSGTFSGNTTIGDSNATGMGNARSITGSSGSSASGTTLDQSRRSTSGSSSGENVPITVDP